MSTPFDALSDDQNPDFDQSTKNTEETLAVPEVTELDVPEGGPSEASSTPSEASGDPLVSTLPPEAQGETNGGPLGCCLGTIAGLFLTLSIILVIPMVVGHSSGYLGWATRPIVVFGTLIGAYIGWRVGKLIYREYELSPERRARLERLDQQWNSRQRQSKQIRLPKTK